MDASFLAPCRGEIRPARSGLGLGFATYGTGSLLHQIAAVGRKTSGSARATFPKLNKLDPSNRLSVKYLCQMTAAFQG